MAQTRGQDRQDYVQHGRGRSSVGETPANTVAVFLASAAPPVETQGVHQTGSNLDGLRIGWRIIDPAGGVLLDFRHVVTSSLELRDQSGPAVEDRQDLVRAGRGQPDIHAGDAEIAIALHGINVLRRTAQIHRQGLRIAAGLLGHPTPARHEFLGTARARSWVRPAGCRRRSAARAAPRGGRRRRQ